MKFDWIEFRQELFDNQKLPDERRYVLIQIGEDLTKGMPPTVAVGYLRYAAGCKDSPYFVILGVDCSTRFPYYWCDCLGDDFNAPLWKGKQSPPKRERE